jgi:DNA-binding NarL/FixJ family response regulator
MLTMRTEEPYVLGALRSGFVGYVLKNQPLEDLIQAIADVSAGGIYMSPAISVAAVEAWKSGVSGQVLLCPRERQTLQLISEGHATKDAAYRLGISVKTAEAHRRNLMAKLGIHTTAELVRYGIRCGLVQP